MTKSKIEAAVWALGEQAIMARLAKEFEKMLGDYPDGIPCELLTGLPEPIVITHLKEDDENVVLLDVYLATAKLYEESSAKELANLLSASRKVRAFLTQHMAPIYGKFSIAMSEKKVVFPSVDYGYDTFFCELAPHGRRRYLIGLRAVVICTKKKECVRIRPRFAMPVIASK
jgi:hypothetical protein